MRQIVTVDRRMKRLAWAWVATVCTLGITNSLLAGTQVAPPEHADMGPSVDPLQLPSQEMVLEETTPSPIQRIDTQDADIDRDLAALMRLADSPSVRAQLKSKRLPRGGQAMASGQAAWTLGLIYLHGAGVPQDTGKAQIWFERAVALGTKQALAGLAWCAIGGCTGIPTPADANQWIRPLRSVDRPLALYLEWLALDRLTPLRTASADLQAGEDEPPLVAPHLLNRAANEGNIHALIELGLNAVAQQQPDKALRFFQRAAKDSVIAAANAAIVAQSDEPKRDPRSDASKAGMELLTQAQRFHRGEGVPVNYAEAIRLYRIAADKGNVEAQRMLALIYSRPLVGGNIDVAWMGQLSELDLARSTPGLRVPTAPRQLQRERTALIDLLPEKWRARIL